MWTMALVRQLLEVFELPTPGIVVSRLQVPDHANTDIQAALDFMRREELIDVIHACDISGKTFTGVVIGAASLGLLLLQTMRELDDNKSYARLGTHDPDRFIRQWRAMGDREAAVLGLAIGPTNAKMLGISPALREA